MFDRGDMKIQYKKKQKTKTKKKRHERYARLLTSATEAQNAKGFLLVEDVRQTDRPRQMSIGVDENGDGNFIGFN